MSKVIRVGSLPLIARYAYGQMILQK